MVVVLLDKIKKYKLPTHISFLINLGLHFSVAIRKPSKQISDFFIRIRKRKVYEWKNFNTTLLERLGMRGLGGLITEISLSYVAF